MDIRTFVQTAVFLMGIGVVVSLVVGWRAIREGRRIHFYRLRQQKMSRGLRLFGLAALLSLFGLRAVAFWRTGKSHTAKKDPMQKRLRKGFQHYGLVLLKSPGVVFKSPRYIFVMSHMRSFSTLLAHILGSHPQISGYSEMQLRYGSASDLLKLRLRVANSLDYRLDGSFVLDKILHNRFAVAPELFGRADIFWIYLLRRPEATVKSIMHLWKMQGNSADKRAEDAVQYYTQRLQQLETYHAQSKNRVLIEGEDLINEPARTLTELAEYLELSSPLLPEYKSFRFTGKAGYGDSSELIGAGKIIRMRDDHSMFHISEELGYHCQQSYDRFIAGAKK